MQSIVGFTDLATPSSNTHVHVDCSTSTMDIRLLHVHILYIYANERCKRKEERSKQGQTNNKAKQHNTPKAVTFHRKMSCLEHVSIYRDIGTALPLTTSTCTTGGGFTLTINLFRDVLFGVPPHDGGEEVDHWLLVASPVGL